MENSKEILKKLVDYLTNKTGKKQWELSVGAGYEKETLTQMKAKPDGQDAVIDTLKRVYRKALKNSIYEIEEIDEPGRQYNYSEESSKVSEPLIEYLTKQLEKKDEKINELYQKIGELETKTKSENQVPPRLKRAK